MSVLVKGGSKGEKDMRKHLALILLTMAFVSACNGGAFTQSTAERTLTGGAIGAASGALIGAGAGDPATGALIGGGAGILGGYLYDQYLKHPGPSY
jgi:osmotically inducible lipoprotein OsmB